MEELILWIAPAIDWLWNLDKWSMLLILFTVAVIAILTDTKPKASSPLDRWVDKKTKELEHFVEESERVAKSKKEE